MVELPPVEFDDPHSAEAMALKAPWGRGVEVTAVNIRFRHCDLPRLLWQRMKQKTVLRKKSCCLARSGAGFIKPIQIIQTAVTEKHKRILGCTGTRLEA